MGQCCGNSHYVVGEEFIIGLLHQNAFFLATYDYNSILNELCSIRTQQSIIKKDLEGKLIPKLYDRTIPQEQMKYYECLMNHILNLLKQTSNIYEVLILFYPFLNHSEEQVEEKLYATFNYMNGGEISIAKFEELFTKYIQFATKGVTYAFWKECKEDELIRALDMLNTEVFTTTSIERFIGGVIDLVMRKLGTDKSQLMTVEAYSAICKKWDIVNFESIRNHFISKY